MFIWMMIIKQREFQYETYWLLIAVQRITIKSFENNRLGINHNGDDARKSIEHNDWVLTLV